MKELNQTQCRFLADHIDNSQVTYICIYEDHSIEFKIKVTSQFLVDYFSEATGIGTKGYYHWYLNAKELKELLPKVIPYLNKRKKVLEEVNIFISSKGITKKTLYKKLRGPL